MDYSPPGPTVHGILQARILTGVGCHSLLQGIVPTQGWNLGLLYYTWILYHLSTREALHPAIKEKEIIHVHLLTSAVIQIFPLLHVFPYAFEKTIQNKRSGLFHPFIKASTSVTTPDTHEKSTSRVGHTSGVLARQVRTPSEAALPLVTTVGCSHRLNVSPQ